MEGKAMEEKATKLYLVKSLAPWMMEELKSFSTFTKFKIIFLKKVSKYYKSDLEILKENGIDYYIKPFNKKIKLKDFFFVIWTIISHPLRLIGKNNFKWTLHGIACFLLLDKEHFEGIESIHAQFASQATIAAWFIHKMYKIDYHFTFHAHDIYCNNRWFHALVNSSSSAISISKFNIDYVVKKYKVNPGKISLARLGLVLPQFVPKIKNGSNHHTILGFMSNLEQKKGIPYLMEAFLEINRRNPEKYELWIAGKGEDNEYIENFLETHNLDGKVKLLGQIRDQKKVDFFTSIDIFVLPSIKVPHDMDGIPVVLMEAIGYGKPIISTDVSGIPEICVNDYDGKLIPEKNIEELVNAIDELSNNNEKINELSTNALTLAKEEYNLTKNSKLKLKEMHWIEN